MGQITNYLKCEFIKLKLNSIVYHRLFFLLACIAFLISLSLHSNKFSLIPNSFTIIRDPDLIDQVESNETTYTPKPAQGADLILIPAIVSNRGVACKIMLILDTGCSLTTLDKNLTATLQFQPTGRIVSINANGSQGIKETGVVDYIQIGPIREENFLVSNLAVLGNKRGDISGFLGMNFLERHPFTIDHKRKVIIWQ